MTRSLLYLTSVIIILITSNLDADLNSTIVSILGIGKSDTLSMSQDGLIKNSETKNGLEIWPNKNIFRPGEMVVITARNNGVEPLIFPDATLGMLIENIKTKERFGLISAQVLTSLEPGQSTSLQWDQHGFDGSQADAGGYRVSVTTISDRNSPALSAKAYFQIKE
jgi:hypothetical protein